jgi:restriction endonuclease S subunit
MKPIWPTKKLGELTRIVTGKLDANRADQDGLFPFYTCSDEILRINKTAFDGESILVAGNGDFWVKYHESGLFNAYQRTYVIQNEKDDEAITKYLYYSVSLQTPKFKKMAQGGIIKFLHLRQLQNLKIPLPPLKIQKQIVERLDKIAEAQKLNDELIQKSDELFQSLLHKELDPTGKKWEVKKLGDEEIVRIIDGDRGKNYPSKSEFKKIGYCIFLNTKNVTQDGFVFNEVDFISNERDEKLRKGRLQRNDVVLTTRGTVGNSALYDDSIEFNHIRINSGMVILRPNTEKIIPKFLWLVIGGGITQNQFKRILSGTAQPQLPIVNLVKIKFPLPPLKIQKQIVAKLSATQEYKNQLLIQKSKLQELFESVLNKSFKGEL